MRNFSKTCGVVAAVAFVAAAPRAVAEEVAKNACQEIGHGSFESLGDREGHGILIVSASCRVESGPLEGGVLTAQYVWEWDKTTAALTFGGGIVRKAGATVVYQYTEGKTTLIMTDGKVTGYTSSGKGRWAVASGSAASLAGKTFTWESKPTGVGQYDTVWTAD
jgi:hypothetical protein